MRIYFAFVFVIALTANVFAQDTPTVKYSGTKQNRRVIEMSNMLGEVDIWSAKEFPELLSALS